MCIINLLLFDFMTLTSTKYHEGLSTIWWLWLQWELNKIIIHMYLFFHSSPVFDEMPIKGLRYLSQSTDSLNRTNQVTESLESLTDEGEHTPTVILCYITVTVIDTVCLFMLVYVSTGCS